MAKVSYAEGDWFAVPLRDQGFAVGIVARVNSEGVLLGYFFGPRHLEVPCLDVVTGLRALDAILVKKFGHLGLRDGRWPILGRNAWSKRDWPMPHFGRYEELTGRSWEVAYDDDDPNVLVRETPLADEVRVLLPDDGAAGAGWIELRLTRLLGAL